MNQSTSRRKLRVIAEVSDSANGRPLLGHDKGFMFMFVPLYLTLLGLLPHRKKAQESKISDSPVWISDKFIMSHFPKTRFMARAHARSPSPSQL